MKHRYDCDEALRRVAPRWSVIWLLFAMNTAVLLAVLRWPEITLAIAENLSSQTWRQNADNGALELGALCIIVTGLCFEFLATPKSAWSLAKELVLVPDSRALRNKVLISCTAVARFAIAASPVAFFGFAGASSISLRLSLPFSCLFVPVGMFVFFQGRRFTTRNLDRATIGRPEDRMEATRALSLVSVERTASLCFFVLMVIHMALPGFILVGAMLITMVTVGIWRASIR